MIEIKKRRLRGLSVLFKTTTDKGTKYPAKPTTPAAISLRAKCKDSVFGVALAEGVRRDGELYHATLELLERKKKTMLPNTAEETIVTAIAIACHESNRRYCKEIGDDSQVPWDEAPQWQKDSAIAGVRGHLSGEIKTPEQSHEAWLAHKKADGWKYGPVKDVEKKEHPCFVPYADLPEEQQAKDKIFSTVVESCAGLMNLLK